MLASQTVDLSKAKSLDEIAYLWAKFLLSELMARRERQEAALASCIFTFENVNNFVHVPTSPTAVLGTPPQKDKALACLEPETYAYLVLVPGVPVPKEAWEGAEAPMSSQEQAEIPLGVPSELIDLSRPHIWWLNAVFVSPSIQATFCAGFDGETFTELREVAGTHGGAFSSLAGIGLPEA